MTISIGQSAHYQRGHHNSRSTSGALASRGILSPFSTLAQAKLPVDVHLGKLLLLGCLFNCLDATLTIVAALNAKSPWLTPFGRESEADAAKRSFKTENSDFLTLYKVLSLSHLTFAGGEHVKHRLSQAGVKHAATAFISSSAVDPSSAIKRSFRSKSSANSSSISSSKRTSPIPQWHSIPARRKLESASFASLRPSTRTATIRRPSWLASLRPCFQRFSLLAMEEDGRRCSIRKPLIFILLPSTLLTGGGRTSVLRLAT